MNPAGKPARPDWAAMALLFAVSLATRVACRSHLVYHGDSAEFALAITNYSVALSQPHAPGYFLYVMLGRLVNFFLGDPNGSLVWLSVVCGSVLVAVIYWLGCALFDRRCGWVAALLALTSPQLWFHSCVALTYVVDALLVTVLVLWCWRALARGGPWVDAIIVGVLLAIIGGVRPQTAPALAPLVLYTFWHFERRRLAKLVSSGLIALALGLAWFVPMVMMSGGFPLYLDIVRRHAANNARVTWWGGGSAALLDNIARAGVFCWDGLLLGAVALAAALLYRVWWQDRIAKRRWDEAHRTALSLLAAWMVPMILLGTVVGFTSEAGYVLSYLPGLLLLAGLAISRLRQRPLLVAVTVAVSAANLGAFLSWPRFWAPAGFGARLTAPAIREHDRQLAGTVAFIRSHYRPADVLVCHAEYFSFGFRHFQVCLPEFDHYQMWRDATMVGPVDRPCWRAHQGRLESVAGLEGAAQRVALLVVPPGRPLSIWAGHVDLRRARPVSGSAGLLYVAPVAAVRP